MSDHDFPVVERHCDVAVVGGSAAGLAAALQLVRQRRSVIVVDSGEPRNAPAAHTHGYLGRDGAAPPEPTAAGREEVRSYGGELLSGRVERVTRSEDGRFRVELTEGHGIVARRVVAATALTEVFGEVVETDATGATSVPGLYAAGNLADPSRQVLSAAADGSRVGAMVSLSLAEEDLRADNRPLGNQADWDHRYAGEPMWSGNPNGALVREVSGLAPGRALDVGAGEGGDALWLAEQGWDVTASDVSRSALDRISSEAGRRGVSVTVHHADANAAEAFEVAAFDLVSASYASIPRTPDGRAVDNILATVAPGGTLLVLGHDLEAMREPVAHGHSRPFDPDAYVRVDDFAAALAGPDWEIETHEKRARPPGAASAAHHAEDIVLRARRTNG